MAEIFDLHLLSLDPGILHLTMMHMLAGALSSLCTLFWGKSCLWGPLLTLPEATVCWKQ